ncbi:MAG: hydroxymethylbilane synthase [Gammaproteobacteria bacterium]|nr:hydroxymethylbilane synthase [Gammaproteobacteria bacterium]
MSKRMNLRLGTRPSLLAIAQSRLVARALERRYPELGVELVNVCTRGDRDRHTPLTRVNDPGFFAAELDEALRGGDVDFCVHSYKDLGPDRPADIALAAIPPRENPRDAVLFSADVRDKLERGETVRIGSSSLRRQINIGDFLPRALPNDGKSVAIEFHALRGPVHERLARIDAGNEGLDGVVLALAGLARLWQDADGHAAIAPLLADAMWMVLPLSECPTAAGQGALAVECRADDERTRQLLGKLHDPGSAALVAAEVDTIERHAKGIETGVGSTSSFLPALGLVTLLRGRASPEDGRLIAVAESSAHAQPGTGSVKAWSDDDWRRYTQRRKLSTVLPETGAVFAAHWHALDSRKLNPDVRCWTSGVASWLQMARQGLWVEGCADNLGFESIKATLSCPVLALPELNEWTALTHADAIDGWQGSGTRNALATYESVIDSIVSDELDEQLVNCTHFYWSSVRQYQSLKPCLPETAHHACGPGKTLTALREAGLDNVQAFASRKEWQQWLA